MLKKFLDILSKDLGDADKKAQVGLSKLKHTKEIVIGRHRVKIDQKIAEGGYADIYRVTDCNKQSKSRVYALKRMFIQSNKAPVVAESLNAFQERSLAGGDSEVVLKAYECEVSILKHLSGGSYLETEANSS